MKSLLVLSLLLFFGGKSYVLANNDNPFKYSFIVKVEKPNKSYVQACSKTTCKTVVGNAYTDAVNNNVEVTVTASCCSTVSVTYSGTNSGNACEAAQQMSSTNASFCANAQLTAMTITAQH
jgi:hypothetical protein